MNIMYNCIVQKQMSDNLFKKKYRTLTGFGLFPFSFSFALCVVSCNRETSTIKIHHKLGVFPKNMAT